MRIYVSEETHHSVAKAAVLLGLGHDNVRTVGVSPTALFRLAQAALAIEPGNVRNITMPAALGWKGKMSVVFVKQPDAGGIFADFDDDGVLEGH